MKIACKASNSLARNGFELIIDTSPAPLPEVWITSEHEFSDDVFDSIVSGVERNSKKLDVTTK